MVSTESYASRYTATASTKLVIDHPEEAVRVYTPHAHFYPLPPELFVPQWMLQVLTLGQVRKGEESLWYPGIDRWRWQPGTFEQVLTDDRPWRLGYALVEGEVFRYHPSEEEGGDPLTYVATDDVIEVRNGFGELMDEAYWRRKIVWPD